MSPFDERAEAAAERGKDRRNNSIPPNVKRAVQKALATGHRKLEDDLESLDVLWRTRPDNPNAPVEQGPPPPGSYSYDRGVEFFDRVAEDVRKVRDAVSKVDFDADDKQKFRAGLKEIAVAWELRASAARSTDPNALANAVTPIAEREAKASSYMRSLKPYFRK